MSSDTSKRNWRLAIDTATRQSTVALGDGRVRIAQSTRVSEHRHGATLLEQIQEVLDEAGAQGRDIQAIGVGTGPGSFTGLRVGLATAKTLAYLLACPIVGIPTSDAIARAVAESGGATNAGGPSDPAAFAVVLPAGARDHYLAVPGVEPHLVPAGGDLAAAAAEGARLPIAVDLPGSGLGVDAAERGAEGLRGLGAAMLAILDERLAAGATDDVAALVPAYVALPRGISAAVEGMAWSPDLR